MPWFSRFFPPSPSVQRLAAKRRSNRTRQSRQRPSMTTVETLEHRALLSTVTAVVQNGILTVTGDTHNDSFSITENKDGTVTLMGTDKKTHINNGKVGAPYTTTEMIGGIVVSLPGTGMNSDQVTVTGLGQKVSSRVKNISITVTGQAALNLKVNNVDSSGTLTVVDGTSTTGGGALIAAVDNSRFVAATITQTGNSTADVELGNVIINRLIVKEGNGKNDSVDLNGGRFGSIEIWQG